MLKNLQKTKNQKGFTIIEVLIVLAIAGLILLIVFLAVPQLQRNSRDTQRKNDISKILGATQEVLNNNNGQISSLSTANVIAAEGTLSYYANTEPSAVTAMAAGVAAGSGLNATTTDTVTIYTKATCDGTTGKAISGSARQIAVVYKIESGGGTLQCTNS